MLLLQSVLWHWRLRASCLLWAAPELETVGALPDAPWGALGAVRRRVRRLVPRPPVAGTDAAGES